ncbi:MAG: lamin tail domain-containing protein [Micrococcales bacterium]|nr:lamin tail domain-containing protein [Micrococcales bacterium]
MMRSRPLFAALASAFAVAATVAMAAPAHAAPVVKVTRIHYDSYGSAKDNYTNASLNDEYVVIKNMTGTARMLTGWTLRDKTGFTYRFPTYRLAAYASVTVRTGKGSATQANRYYNKSSYVWNNNTDTAYLRNSAGTLIHSCSYNDGTSTTTSTKTC